jgi:hypothetical protein
VGHVLSEAEAETVAALGLEPGEPTPRLFEDLFLRFTRLVPHERVSRRADRARTPEEVLAAHLEEGLGAAGAERVETFLALARGLGYDAHAVAAEGARTGRLVLARLAGRRVLADVETPLGLLVPVDDAARDLPGPTGRLSLERVGGGLRLVEEGRGEQATVWTTELLPAPEAGEDPEGAPLLVRLDDDRRTSWDGRAVEVIDAWSRLVYAPPDAEALDALFRVPSGPLPAGPAVAPTLTVWDSHDHDPARLRRVVASPDGQRRLLPPGVSAGEPDPTPTGWAWTLRDETGGFLRRDHVEPLGDGARVTTLEGETPVSSRRLRVDEGRLELTAVLSRPIPPRGPADSVRKTLVFHLVTELLALAGDPPIL